MSKKNEHWIHTTLNQITEEAIGLVDDTELLPEARLREDLGADSLDLIILAQQIEFKLGIEFDNILLAEIKTIGQLKEKVTELYNEKIGRNGK